MTKDEFKKCLTDIRKEYDEKVKNLKKEYIRSNARFKKGDKIRLKDKSIIVENILGTCFSSDIPSVYYFGTLLTKNGTPRKDGQEYSIFEQDGIELLSALTD